MAIASKNPGLSFFDNLSVHNDDFDKFLRGAANKPMTKEEKREQRISFVMGTLSFDSTTTREYVAEVVDSIYG